MNAMDMFVRTIRYYRVSDRDRCGEIRFVWFAVELNFVDNKEDLNAKTKK